MSALTSDREALVERAAEAVMIADFGGEDGILPNWVIPWAEQDDAEYGDYRQKCRRIARAILALLPAASGYARGVEDAPVAWLHTLHMEGGRTSIRATPNDSNPFGIPGRDYSEEYAVTSEPLFKRAVAACDDLRAASLAASPMKESGSPEREHIWVQYSDDGSHIRRWSRQPFEGAQVFQSVFPRGDRP